MPLWTCDSSGCTKEMKSVVLDANWRWLHNGEYTNCLVLSATGYSDSSLEVW